MGNLMPEASQHRQPAEQPVVLVVDDEPDLLELVSLTLSRMNLKPVLRPTSAARASC